MISLRPIHATAALLALGLAACQPYTPAEYSPRNPPPPVALSGTLSGNQEVPMKAVAGTGNVYATLDRATNVLTYTVSYAGLTGPLQAAHFHGPAPAGVNAGVALPITVTYSPLNGAARLTPAMAADVERGLWYVNLHTPNYPDGELRAQVTVAPAGYAPPPGAVIAPAPAPVYVAPPPGSPGPVSVYPPPAR